MQRWAQDVYLRFFCGMADFDPRLPCDDSQIGRFRQGLGEAGIEQSLKTTIETAVGIKFIKPGEFERVIVDSTVQEKAIAFNICWLFRAIVCALACAGTLLVPRGLASQGGRLVQRVQVSTPMSCSTPVRPRMNFARPTVDLPKKP